MEGEEREDIGEDWRAMMVLMKVMISCMPNTQYG